MDLPEEITLKHILQQGGAFRAKLDGEKFRYYFVLNLDPQTDEIIILSTSTTAFELHRNCEDADDVHIPLAPEDYKWFTANCLICCNRPSKIPKEHLISKLNNQRYEILEPLPKMILEKILKGIEKSRVVEPSIKEAVLGSGE